MYFSEKVRLSSTSLSLMRLIGALNSLLVTVTQLYLITLCLFKFQTSVAEACQSEELNMDTNRYLKAVNIEWDVDLAEDLDSLPKEVQIPDGMTDTEEISDYLSNLTGFCHRGFGLKET